MKSPKSALYILLIILASLLMYLPSLSRHFLWDDHTIIECNPVLRSAQPGLLFKQTYWPPIQTTAPAPYYRPITILCFWIEYHIFGKSALLFRIFNLSIFSVTIVLFFLLVRKIFACSKIALWSAAVFALNPIHTESVAFISGMTDVLATFFILLAVLAFSSDKKWLKYSIAPLFFLLALFSKESAIAGIFIFVLYEFFLGRSGFRAKIASIAVFIPPVMLYLFLRIGVVGVVGGYKMQSLSLFERLVVIPYILMRYIQNILFPFDLAPLHPQWYSDHSTAFWLMWLIPVVFVAILLAYTIRGRRLWFGMSWAMLFLLPALRIGAGHQGALWAERFAYISSVGTSFIVGYYLSRLSRTGLGRNKAIGKIVALAYIALLFAIGFEYSFWWRNDWMGFRRIIKSAPHRAEGYSGMAEQFFQIGELDSAYAYINLALEQDSTYLLALETAPDILMKMGRYQDALLYSKKLIRSDSTYPAGYISAGWASLALGDTNNAINFCRRAADIAPINPFAQQSYAEIMLAIGDTAEGLKYLDRTIQLLPDQREIRDRYREIAKSFLKKKFVQ